MAMKLKKEWLTENFDDGEMTTYYEENDFTEYELFLLDNQEFIDLEKNFTLMKGILLHKIFNYTLYLQDSNDSLDLISEIENNIETVKNSLNLNFLKEGMEMKFDRTHDCQTNFHAHLQWIEKIGNYQPGKILSFISISIHKFHLLLGKAADIKEQWNFNGGTLGNLTVDNLIVEDFCPIKTPHTAFKSRQRDNCEFYVKNFALVSIGLTKVKLNTDPKWEGVMKDHTLHIMRTLLKQVFGEMFYRVLIMGFKQHHKGILIIESAALIGKIKLFKEFLLISYL